MSDPLFYLSNNVRPAGAKRCSEFHSGAVVAVAVAAAVANLLVDFIMRCPHFSSFDYQAIEALRVLPPLEPKDKSISWARGSIRDAEFNELLVTGPRLPVLFSGCRFNSIVFSIRGPSIDEPSYAFEVFLHKILSRVENAVTDNMEKFKPGLKNAALLQFDRDFIRPSSYGTDLPNEFRVRLAVKHGGVLENGEVGDVIETVFVDEDGNTVDPESLTSGAELIPIFRVGYYRNANKFGLNITMLKAVVYQSPKRQKLYDYGDLMIDFPAAI